MIDHGCAEFLVHASSFCGNHLGDLGAEDFHSLEFVACAFGGDGFDHWTEHTDVGDDCGELLSGGRPIRFGGFERQIERRQLHLLQEGDAGFWVVEEVFRQLSAKSGVLKRLAECFEVVGFHRSRKCLGKSPHLQVVQARAESQEIGGLFAGGFSESHGELRGKKRSRTGGFICRIGIALV